MALSEPGGRIPFDLAVALLDEAASKGQAITLSPRGGSMAPTIRAGDRVVAQRVAAGEVRRGEIVLYRRGDWVVAHRVVGRRQVGPSWQLLTLGDFGLRLDDPVDEDQLLARVVRVERKGRCLDLSTRGWRLLSGVLARYLLLGAWVRTGLLRIDKQGRAAALSTRVWLWPYSLPLRVIFGR